MRLILIICGHFQFIHFHILKRILSRNLNTLQTLSVTCNNLHFECKPEFDEFGIEYDNARTSKKRKGKLVIFRFNQNDIDQ